MNCALRHAIVRLEWSRIAARTEVMALPNEWAECPVLFWAFTTVDAIVPLVGTCGIADDVESIRYYAAEVCCA